jgi:hypothetical protein
MPGSTKPKTAKALKAEQRKEFKAQLDYLDRAFLDLNRVTKMVTSSKRGVVTIDGEEFTPETVKDLQTAFRSQLKGLQSHLSSYGKKDPKDREPKSQKMCIVTDAFAKFVEKEVGIFPPEVEELREKKAFEAIYKGHVASQGVIMSLVSHFITRHLDGENKRWRDNGTFAKYFKDTRLILNGQDYTPKELEKECKLSPLERLAAKNSRNYSKSYDIKVVEDGEKVTKHVTEDVFSGNRCSVTSLCNMFKVDPNLLEDDNPFLLKMKKDRYIKAIQAIHEASTRATAARRNASKSKKEDVEESD